jgi:hypothetical protein
MFALALGFDSTPTTACHPKRSPAHFHLYEPITTMPTSVVRFNYNSARANQSQLDTSCPPFARHSTHPLPQFPSLWHRASSLKNPRRLIANPRLEFHVTPIRISQLRSSNRKFSAILRRPDGLLESQASSLQKPRPLIETRGLENAITPINPNTCNFLIETKRGFCVRRGGTGFSPHNPRLVVSQLPRLQGLAMYRLGNCSRRLFIFGISQIWM